MLSRKECANEIKKIVNTQEPIASGIRLPIARDIEHEVFEIPIELLKPNPENDRIASKIREFEATQGRKLSADDVDDVNFVYNMIWEEHPSPNKKTLEDLAKNDQQEFGVVTFDGIIVDGNRRATLIKKLYDGEAKNYNRPTEKFRYFKAIVLDESFSTDEIRVLETALQLGKDEKVPYDPINVYIKIDNLIKSGKNTAQIAGYMNSKETEIKSSIEVFKMMKEYLEYHSKDDYFTMLDGLQDQFIRTQSVISKMENMSYRADWDYKQADVIDFKSVCFEVLRSKPEGKKYRSELVGGPTKRDGVFAKEKAWKTFKLNHGQIIENSTLNNDSDWRSISEQFINNLDRVRKAYSEEFDELDVRDKIQALFQKAKALEGAIDSLQEIDNELLNYLSKVEKIVRKIREEFGK